MECSENRSLWVRQADHDRVTMEQENSTKVRQTSASMKQVESPHMYFDFLVLAKYGKQRQRCQECLSKALSR